MRVSECAGDRRFKDKTLNPDLCRGAVFGTHAQLTASNGVESRHKKCRISATIDMLLGKPKTSISGIPEFLI